jgi:hypothetical protein
VVVYDPESKEVIHYESSLDGNSWTSREQKYRKNSNLAENTSRKFFLGCHHINFVRWRYNNVPPGRRDFVGAGGGLFLLGRDKADRAALGFRRCHEGM